MRSLVLLALAAACATPPTPPPEPFTAMTFNIRYGSAHDGEDAWPKRRDDVAALLTANAPAILGVQEALAFQLEFLATHLPHHLRVGQGRDGGTQGEHAALFIDARRFAIATSGDFWLSETPDVVGSIGWDAALTRICTFAELREVDTGRTLWVWNAHFDHRGPTARARSGELLAARVRAHAGPHIVLGDFNCGEQSPALAALRQAGLRDTWRDVEPTTAAAGTFHAFRGGRRGEKIDYVLADAGLATQKATILDQPGARGRWPSDHHAVLATLTFGR